MTPADYLSATRFPLTTQAGLDPSSQLLQDAFNWQALQEAIEDGDKLTASQQAVYAELGEKMPHNKRLARQVATEEMRRQELAEVAAHPANQFEDLDEEAEAEDAEGKEGKLM